MTHPAESRLALYAGKDLGLWARVRIARHLHQCGRCNQHVEELRGIRQWMRAQDSELPPDLNWNVLAAEMKANIRLGLAAGQCVASPAQEPLRLPWRTPAVVLPVLLVIVAGWVLLSLHPPLHPVQALHNPNEPGGVVLEASSSGIGLEKDGRGFALLHPRAENVVFSVRGDAVRSRYVDGDTGQVTISHVYAQ